MSTYSESIHGVDTPDCPKSGAHSVWWHGDRGTGSGAFVCRSCAVVIFRTKVIGKCPACEAVQTMPAAECVVCGGKEVAAGF